MVDVFSAAPAGRKEGGYSTSSGARAYGNPDSFNVLRLDPPIQFASSPCNSMLEGKIESHSPAYPEWFIPTASGGQYQTNTFLIDDLKAPNDNPPDYSPSIFPFRNFWRSLGKAEWVCGPALAYRNGDRVQHFPATDLSLFDYERHISVSEDGFGVRKTPDGTVLIKVGPRVWNAGSPAQCGGCPITEMKIFALTEMKTFALGLRNLLTLLDLGGVIGNSGPYSQSPMSQDFSISADWSRLTEYDEAGEENPVTPAGPSVTYTWSSVTYCLRGGNYVKCGEGKNVKPPALPLIRQLE